MLTEAVIQRQAANQTMFVNPGRIVHVQIAMEKVPQNALLLHDVILGEVGHVFHAMKMVFAILLKIAAAVQSVSCLRYLVKRIISAWMVNVRNHVTAIIAVIHGKHVIVMTA